MSRIAKDMIIMGLFVFAVLYLIYPSWLPDFIPDFIPVIGQIDDSAAVGIILSTLRYYNIMDFTAIYGKREKQKALPENNA